MNKYFKFVIFLFVLLAIACSNEADKQMTKMVKELNKAAPFFVNEHTRFDSASYNNSDFSYNYCLINTVKEDIDLKEFEKEMYPQLTSFVNSNPSMKDIRRYNTKVVYKYYDSKGKLITSFIITP